MKTLCPLQRIDEAGEVAALAHFLASDDCRYLNGVAIPLDGGLSAGFGYPLLDKVMMYGARTTR
ncbi:MAG: hypothetical protein ACK5HY_13940 [Parahaliea sp.]